MDDLISRREAIDAIVNWTESHHENPDGDDCIMIILDVPSAQPEPCVNTIDALNESIKHFDDMAEECRRNANIERNDYMDMRDDAAEYRQLSIWLNELKWLRERFQSQPEIIHCKDCIFHGLCRASTRWAVAPKDDWYCADAERKTDDLQ